MGIQWKTIPINPETKELLEKLKKKYDVSSYDELIRRLLKPPLAVTYDLSKEVPPATGITWEDNYVVLEGEGHVKLVVVHFPPGCKSLVKVRIGVATPSGIHWICPENGYLALDNITLSLGTIFPFNKNDKIVAEIYNYDDTFPHRIGIYVLVEYK